MGYSSVHGSECHKKRFEPILGKMKILAIDPGNIESGFVIWDGKTICKKGIIENSEFLDKFATIIRSYGIRFLAMEMVASYGMPVGATVFETCFWAGRFIQEFTNCSKFYSHINGFELVYRKDVKMHLCQSMRAKDGNIRQALIDRFEPGLRHKQRPIGVLKGVSKDIWAALAVAVYYYDTIKNDSK